MSPSSGSDTATTDPHGTSLWRWLIADERHGPLPALLLALTVLTGVVDAVSILALGRVFVANMTGNIVFVGFAIGGAPGFSLSASLSALGGFLLGAFAGGRAIVASDRTRGVLLRDAVACEAGLLVAALILGIATGTPFSEAVRDVLAALLATAMGLQNTVARKLAVPDLTTTVLTMTLTGIAADPQMSARNPVVVRRLLAVAGMLIGAIVGALLVVGLSAVAALALAAGLVGAVSAAASLVARRSGVWQ
ncbi:MAG: YoaK family protein [Solirubrobacteraceae bacterium]